MDPAATHPDLLGPLRQAWVDHWIEHMPTQPDYIVSAIKTHFQNHPLDKPLMWPRLAQAYKKLGITT
jgi:hypothetical protein